MIQIKITSEGQACGYLLRWTQYHIVLCLEMHNLNQI